MNEAKSILLSKVFWANVVAIIAGMLEAKDVIDVLPNAVLPYLASIVAVINIVLRTITTQPVEVRLPKRVYDTRQKSVGEPQAYRWI